MHMDDLEEKKVEGETPEGTAEPAPEVAEEGSEEVV